jgi:hypothetical protein
MKARRRDERGVVAIMAAMLSVVLLTCAALSVDVASQVDQRQVLHNTLDTAALSGAMLLPDATAATTQALAVAHTNDPSVTPIVTFFCIVGSTGTPPVVNPLGIPGSCNPGPAPYTAATYPGLKCNSAICSIPCFAAQGDSCNAIQLVAQKDVPFNFAPVIGINKGSTGSLSSVACKGGCGSPVITPIDLAIIADRTSSMSTPASAAVKTGVQGMLKMFDPANTQVAFGMNSLSKDTTKTCTTHPAATDTDGQWFPISSNGSALFKDYIVAGSKPPALNTASPLVAGINCMTQSNIGTWLAAPIDAATALLTTDPKHNPAAKKALVYMTDGAPNEDDNSVRTRLNVVTAAKPAWGSSSGPTACSHATQAAADAKAAGVIVVTIAYDADSETCGGGGTRLLDELAAMASPTATGPSTSNGCSSPALVAAENSDGDYFFCAAQPSDLASIFQTAAITIAGGSRLMWMP